MFEYEINIKDEANYATETFLNLSREDQELLIKAMFIYHLGCETKILEDLVFDQISFAAPNQTVGDKWLSVFGEASWLKDEPPSIWGKDDDIIQWHIDRTFFRNFVMPTFTHTKGVLQYESDK